MDGLIFETVHGSHLYGLAHAGSDRDVFRVYCSHDGRRRARQRVSSDTDVLSMSLDRFLELASSGAHQCVEAMFSPVKIWDPRFAFLRPFVESHRVAGGRCGETPAGC